MPLSLAAIAFDLSDYAGTDFDARRTKVYATNNVVGGAVIDTDGNKVYLGSGNATIGADGTGTISIPIPGTGSNPASWQTTIHVDYPDRNAPRGRTTRSFGPFTITASANLADLVPQQEVPAEYLTQVTAQLDAKVTEAETAATAAGAHRAAVENVVITDLGTTDGQTKTLIETDGTLTKAALSATFVSMVPPPTGVAATDTAAIQSAITSALGSGRTVVQLQAGDYRTNAPLTVGDDLVIQGTGRQSTRILNAASDIFSWAATGSTIRDLGLVAESGGGHVFKQVGLTQRCHFENLHIDQVNDAKSIYSHTADLGNYLFNKWSHVTPYHKQTATVPTFHFVVSSAAGAINANTFEDMDPTRSGNYTFWFESARNSNYVYDNILRDIRFEAPHGGCVKLLGTNRMTLDSVTVYDITAATRDLFYVGRGTHATGKAPNRNLVMRGLLVATPVGSVKHVTFEAQVPGAAAYIEDTLFDACGTHDGTNLTVDFGDADRVTLLNSRINRLNGDRVIEIGAGGLRLAPNRYLTGKAGAADGVALDAAGNLMASRSADVGLGAQQLLNSEVDTDLRHWSDPTGIVTYTTNKARIQNATGGFVNVTVLSAAALSLATTYKIVVKLASVTAFPVPSTSLRFQSGAGTYVALANTTDEQVFYSTVGTTNGLLFRTGDGLNVEVDYVRVYPISSGQPLTAHGPLAHRGATAGFYGTAPIAKQTVAAAATDAATTQALVNDIRAKLIALGLMS